MPTTLLLLIGATVVASLALLRMVFASFHGQRPEDHEGLAPEFDIKHHLNGPIRCEGVIYGPTGRVTSRFTADMVGTWNGDRGTLAEHFVYDNGDTQDRCWHLELQPDGGLRATADDVIGAGEGRRAGPTVQLRYKIRLPSESGGRVLSALDWMYLVSDDTIINRSQFRKFGITVAELVATMRPKEAT